MLSTCAIVGCIIAVFPILGGILSIKRKMWGFVLASGIIGLLTIVPSVVSGILSLVAIVMVVISRKEFQ
jgi:hypothetical protein